MNKSMLEVLIMNGVISTREESMIDRKPIITCGGELEVFSSLEDALALALPQDSCEWRRSQGRPVKSVHIGVKFTPFSPDCLPRENQWDLIRHPLFHIYWTECTDIDVYKTSVRDDIESWLKELNGRNVTDWLIVVVETYDAKRTNKLLPRTTVLDKIRADFAPKQGDRCISVLSPARAETRTADSWRGLVARVRHLVLVAYARAVTRLEDHVRQQREKRNEPGWHFINYFQLQEELAQVLEMLGLYDESLVQYDELDALFSQFVVNAAAGDAAPWLQEFQAPLERWPGLRLGPNNAPLPAKPSIIELRGYLYAKQAGMLLLTCKPWEMASRCLPFLHTCVKELSLLEVTSPPGALACWLFLACLEVLHTCDRYNDSGQVEAYSLYTAGLWAYASQKLRELGVLCGLLPGDSPSSEQLHVVVGLSAGMGDCPGTPSAPSPTDKLKEALCSKDVFNKNYLELSELAMGTYKHIGRLRSARLVGRELASFYQLLGETQKAAAFLGDALKTFEQDGWRELAVQTHVELASCHLQASDTRKYIRSCAAIAAAPEMDTILRCSYFDEMLKSLDSLNKTLIVPFINILKVSNITLKSHLVMQDTNLEVLLELDSNFPRELLLTNVLISLEPEKTDAKEVKDKDGKVSKTVFKEVKSVVQDPVLQKMRICRHLDYRQDKQIASASVVSKNAPLKRADSTAVKIVKSDFSHALKASSLPLVLTPGSNIIPMTWLATPGRYTVTQVSVEVGLLELLSAPLPVPRPRVEAKRLSPALRLDKSAPGDLLAGLEQPMVLDVSVGSYDIEEGSTISLRCSKHLTLRLPHSSLCTLLTLPLPCTLPFTSSRVPLRVFSSLPAREHHVTIICPWGHVTVPLGFTAPLNVTHRLHTARRRKYLQVIVEGKSTRRFRLGRVVMKADVEVVEMNPVLEGLSAIITSGVTVSYMWELKLGYDENNQNSSLRPIKAEFSVEYTALWEADEEILDQETRLYNHQIDIHDYETLYIVEGRVEPTRGSEFCRVGALCHLRLSIHAVGDTSAPTEPSEPTEDLQRSLMYEVLAEQSVWAVCGRTAGVVSVDVGTGGAGGTLGGSGGGQASQAVQLDVMPLASGFLPLPLIRLSKYIPADKNITDATRKPDMANAHPRLEPFSPGQVYNSSKAQQVHVLAAINEVHAQ